VKLVVSVVSTNWQNDYARKYEDYEALAIPEYWIVDYLGIGGKYYIGSPKQPTVMVCHLVDGEYQKTLLRSDKLRKSRCSFLISSYLQTSYSHWVATVDLCVE
jgi:Uma2 family endonuclease